MHTCSNDNTEHASGSSLAPYSEEGDQRGLLPCVSRLCSPCTCDPPGKSKAWVFRKGLLEAGSSHQYSIAFLWSLTQFTGAFADPWGDQTKGERVFSTFALLFGFLMASCFVSNITSLMTQISMVANHQSHQLKVLTRYLQARDAGVSPRAEFGGIHSLR